MNAKNQKPNLRSEKNQSTSFLIWIMSGLYLLVMVWFLLSTMVAYGAHGTQAVARASSCHAHCFIWHSHAVALAAWKSLAEVNLIIQSSPLRSCAHAPYCG